MLVILKELQLIDEDLDEFAFTKRQLLQKGGNNLNDDIDRTELKKYAVVIRQADARVYARRLRRRFGMSHENIVLSIEEVWGPDMGKYIHSLLPQGYYTVDLGKEIDNMKGGTDACNTEGSES